MSTATPRPEQDADYWRGRYLRESAGLHARLEALQETDDLLRRLASRLCIALSGHDAATDQVILKLRRALRSKDQAQLFEPLLAELGAAIGAMDPNAGREALQAESGQSSAAEHLAHLLDSIEFDQSLRGAARELTQRIAGCGDPSELPKLIGAIAALVNRQSHGLHVALRRFEALFGRINSRLAEMFADVALDAEAFAAAQQSGRTLEQQLLGEMTELGAEVQQSTELDQLQQQVDRRLQRIDHHMQAFRTREQEQSQVFSERAERMASRIAELESQTDALEQAMQRQKRLALVDALTGIANRMAYRDQVQVYGQRARNNGTPLCVAVWDVDHFKGINDNYGHKAGDRALRMIAGQLARILRPCDFVARYGGEEFVMLLDNMTAAQAVPVLDRGRTTIAELPFHHQGEPVPLTISCGVADVGDDHDIELAFERADAALYESKRSGRNRVSSA